MKDHGFGVVIRRSVAVACLLCFILLANRHATAEATVSSSDSVLAKGAVTVGAGVEPVQACNDKFDFEGVMQGLFPLLGTGKVDVLTATVPDPIDTSFASSFDQFLGAIRDAAASAGFSSVSHWLPWQTDVRLPEVVPNHDVDAHSLRPWACLPGVLTFRREGETDSSLIVFLVGESATQGVHRVAMRVALEKALSILEERHLWILGPTFSGSAFSIRQVLDNIDDRQKDEFIFTMRSGSATSPTVKAAVTDAASPRNRFSATVVPDNVQTCALYRYLSDTLEVALDDVAVLVESNTAFGNFLKDFQCKGTDEAPLAPRLVVPFPLHAAQMRSAWNGKRDKKAEAAAALVPAPFAAADLAMTVPESTDQVPLLAPDAGNAGAQLLTEDVMTTICRQRVRYLGIYASDARDVLALGTAALQYCPRLALFTLGPDRILHHVQAKALRGMLVASSYPLHASSQEHVFPYLGGKRLLAFANEAAQGVFNATLLFLGASEFLVDFAELDVGGYAEKARNIARPAVWISAVGRDGLWPIAARPYGDGDRDFVERVEIGTSDRTLRKDRLPAFRSAPPTGFLALTLIVPLFGILNLCGLLAQSNPRAAPSRRRSLWGWLDLYRRVSPRFDVKRRMTIAALFFALILLHCAVLLLLCIPLQLGHRVGLWPQTLLTAVVLGLLVVAFGSVLLRLPLWVPRRRVMQLALDRLAARLCLGVALGFGFLAGGLHASESLGVLGLSLALFYERVTNVMSGLSPAVGGLFYMIALVFAAVSELNRLRLLSFAHRFSWRCFDFTIPFSGTSNVSEKLAASLRTKPWGFVVVFAAMTFGRWFGSADYHHPFEGAWLGILFCRVGPYVVVGMLAFQMLRFARIWVVLRRHLRAEAESHAVPDPTKLFPSHILMCLQLPLDPTLEDQLVRHFRGLRAPGPTLLEEARCARLMLFVSYVRAHMHNLMTFATSCGVALLFISTSYPFKLQHSTSIITGLAIASVLAVAAFVLIEMNRDNVLSVMSGTTPGSISLDASFARSLILHVAVPALGLAATFFPSLGAVVGDWVSPLLQLFKS